MDTPVHKSLRVLFADDEKSLQEFMRTELPRLGHEVTVCPDGRAALKALERGNFDVAILDIRMPGLTGIQVLEQLKQISPHTEAILLTGHPGLDTAVEALRFGAFDYLTKPCKLAEIEVMLQRVAEKRELTNKNLALQRRLKAAEGPTVLVGSSPAMQAVHRLISRIAPTDSTVLILGETGTGKELAARTIFQQSRRCDMPFVPVNCGALSENLVESELFGHRKGAFTGADRDHRGLFEVANGGTVFLDELGELNKNIQVKLLRFLESGEIRRVGENEPFKTDVRVLCATNRDLRAMIERDEFREDLYFRINTFEIRLPPLRERREDIPELARHLLSRAARRPLEQIVELLTPEAIDALLEHDWPGNVRELANVMEHAFILSGGGAILPEHLPQSVRHPRRLTVATGGLGGSAGSGTGSTAPARTLREIEMEHLLRVLEKHGGNKPAAAAELGISLKTLYNKLNQLQEERKQAG
ncbi:MAG: sigma-54 dependent transcriptional regulator [Gemmatales bacterium]|nr:sigma-54 dependent transcriptional regulator [Gemmatales bacterium]MDW8387202.1 sigma-54 dependent transcriptional regulator [Gemmatales bacterium]